MNDIDALAPLQLDIDGIVRLVPCMRITLYLDSTPPAEIIEYCDAALSLLRPNLKHYQAGTMKKPAAINDKAGGIVASWFRRPNERQGCFVSFTDGAAEGTAAGTLRVVLTYRAPATLSPEEQEIRRERRRVLYEERRIQTAPAVAEITLTLPLDSAAAEPAALLAWLLARPLIGDTPFASGHAGLGVNYDRSVADNEVGHRVEGALAYAVTRHPGLDWQKDAILDQIMRYDTRSRDLVPHVKRVNWLTLVSDRAIADAPAGPAIVVHNLAHGRLLQAGPEPALGDSNAADLPTAYTQVGHALKHLRLPHLSGEGRGFSDDLAQHWLTAFDEPAP